MIITEHTGQVTILRLEHGKVNAFDLDSIRALTEHIQSLDPAQGLVLAGTGRLFSAGVDLAQLLRKDLDYTRAFLTELDALVHIVFELPVPVVAALTGHTIAGACLLAAACDYRIMGQGRIGVTEALVGLPIPPAGLEALRFTAGHHTARLVLSGQTLEVHDALALGLIDEITTPDNVTPRAIEIAQQFTSGPAQTFALHKHMLRAEARHRMRQAVVDHGLSVMDSWLAPEPRQFAETYLTSMKARR